MLAFILSIVVLIFIMIVSIGTRHGSKATRREIKELQRLAALPEEVKVRRYEADLADPGGHKEASHRAGMFLAWIGVIALIVMIIQMLSH